MTESFAPAWYIFLTLLGAADYAQQSRHIDAAQELRLDMTPREVIEKMGDPNRRYEADSFLGLMYLKFEPKHWLYGTSTDLHSLVVDLDILHPLPSHARWFSYDDNDVVVRWSYDDQIMEITRPDPIVAPKEFHEILDAGIFVRDLFLLFNLENK